MNLIKGLLLTLFILVTGCSSSKLINQPVELELFKPDVLVKKVWGNTTGSGVGDQFLQLTPFIQGDSIYTVGHGGTLTLFNRISGKRLWKKSLNESVFAGLGGDDKQLYFSNKQGELIALNSLDGVELWRTTLSSEIVSTPSSNGQVVVSQTVDGKVFGLNVQTGKIKWRYDSIAPVLSIRGNGRTYVDGEKTIAGFSNGEVVALDNADGRVLWTFSVGVPKGKTELERLVDVDGKIIVDDGRVFVVSYQGKLSVLDEASGSELWSLPASSYGSPARGLDHVYISSSDSEVLGFSVSSQANVWSQDKMKFRQFTAPVVLSDTVVVADFKGFIHFLSQIDGHLKARARLDSSGVNSPMLVEGNTLYVQGNSGVIAAYQLIQ